MRAGNQKIENNEYDERRRNEYKLDVDKMDLKTGQLDISFSKPDTGSSKSSFISWILLSFSISLILITKNKIISD